MGFILMNFALPIMSLTKAEYSLTIIEDGKVPLANGPMTKSYFGLTLAVMVVLLLLALIICYIVACNKYRKRVMELNGKLGKTEKQTLNWNYLKLKEEVKGLENTVADQLFS